MSASLLGRLGREGMGLKAGVTEPPPIPTPPPLPPVQPHSPPCPHTLTSWQKCPMPRILKEPAGCTFSHLRKTVVPATWDSAQLSSRGVTTWKCPPLALSTRGFSIPATAWPAWGRHRATAQAAPVRAPPNQAGRGGGMGEWRRPRLGSLSPIWLPACETSGKNLLLSEPQFPHLGKNLWTRGLSFCNCGCPQHWGRKTGPIRSDE